MKRKKRTDAATDLWQQMFSRMAEHQNAAIWDSAYDPTHDRERISDGLKGAGWTDEEIKFRQKIQEEQLAGIEEPKEGVSPFSQLQYQCLCDEIEGAMSRLGLNSHEFVARGIEPRIGPVAAKVNVVMTDESIVTIGTHTFRYCGLIARAFTRTLMLNPYLWSGESYAETEGRTLLLGTPSVFKYWLSIFFSYATTGTNLIVPFKPAHKHEFLLFEQIARAMEIFAIAHEYGHHEYNHGRSIETMAAYTEEYEADKFALKISWELENRPLLYQNPYLSSGAGGAILLLSLQTLRRVEDLIAGTSTILSDTHPSASDRIARFDSVAILQPKLFPVLKQYREAAIRIMSLVESLLYNGSNGADFTKVREQSAWKFAEG